MSLSLQDQHLVWKKVEKMLETGSANPNPAIINAFKGLRQFLSTQKGNPQLQLVPFTEAQADAAGGTVIVDAACKLYAAFTKKENSATDNWTWLYDDATNDGTAADAMVCLPQLRANEIACALFPAGFAMGTGIVVTQYATDPLGAVDGSNGADGFIIIGAA